MKSFALLAATATALITFAATPASAIQVLSFGGLLDYGGNYSASSPFFAEGSDLSNKAYSVTLSYDPALFVGPGSSSCLSGPNTSCSFYFSAARPLTETIKIGNTTKTFQLTSGSFDLSSSGAGSPDGFGFNFTSGLSFSGYFQDGDGFFPTQNNVNQPIFKNFSNLTVTTGTFQQNGTGYSFGDSPTSLSASTTGGTVPEAATWAMLVAGFGFMGAAMRRAKVNHSLA